MATATLLTTPPMIEMETFGDLLDALGGIDPARVRIRPTPGAATKTDLESINGRKQGLYELIDGTLVAKPMGRVESMLAATIIALLRNFVRIQNLGIITAPDGTVPVTPTTWRIPDIAFIAWGRIPPGPISESLLAEVAADLVVEVLSPSNTRAEMARKRIEYFAAGVRLVWEVDPSTRTVAVFTGSDEVIRLDATVTLDGGVVLPGFRVPVAEVFADLDRQRP